MADAELAVGDRIEFTGSMIDTDPYPMKRGEQGEVTFVGPWQTGWRGHTRMMRQIAVRWDSGRRLMLLDPIDAWRKM